MKKIYYTLGLLLVLITTGCASGGKLMSTSESGEIEKPDADEAVIVFMRTSFVASAIGVELFEIENDELKFVGSLPYGSKIAHATTPGEKVYMTYGLAADFMLANVEAGKTYYSIVRPNWGTGGFAPTPVRTDGSSKFNTDIPEFPKWVSSTDLLSKKPDAEAWFQKNKVKYQDIYKKYWERFDKKSAEQKDERTMLPSDGS